MKAINTINTKEMENISGGGADYLHVFSCDPSKCKHPNKYRTGADKEDPRWLLFSQHQYEYFCPQCKETIWVDEER